jgi:hypothetical protein
VINAPVSEGKKFLDSLLPTTPRSISPRRQSPRRQSPRRSASPKRPGSPKRKLSEEEIEDESPRPAKRTATKLPAEEPKPVKVYSPEILAD